MKDLLNEYKETRRMLRQQYDYLRDENTPTGYRVPQNNNKIKYIYEGLDSTRQLIGEMLSDIDYVIEWLETGKRPGNKRGIERRAAYQREKLIDPIRMQAFVSNSTAGSPANLTESQKFMIEEAMQDLSLRERECYELAHGYGFSHEYIGKLLNITKGTVDTLIHRAQQKISDRLMNSLFLVG